MLKKTIDVIEFIPHKKNNTKVTSTVNNIPLKLKLNGTWSKKINHLRTQHENNIKTEENETNNGYIIEADVNYEDFIKYADGLLCDTKDRVFFINGSVLIYEFVTDIHEQTASFIVGEIKYHNNNTRNSLNISGASRITFNAGTAAIPNNVSYEPDQSIKPQNRVGPQANNTGLPFPTLVVEVGYSQSLQSLNTKALQYLNPNINIQMVICVKIWNRCPNNTFRALMMFYRRGFAGTNPEQIISFGTAPLHHETRNTINGWNLNANQLSGFGITVNGIPTPVCNQAGMALYTLQIPSADLYNGVAAGVPVCVPATIPLDLFDLQTLINRIPHF
ncbi:hypothetical protein DLAC_02000 [Tieghemostelium lacteum]|uniref:Uncharacterized protein n=1 Tax=Tieghemostelium lacteum TaxID=361077 RepID=A0A152A5B1_TIELA|nr:hypothetical protein DLAC_02000 [Tieghemostelium lacteum]|eukprot:KYR01410.1 hypothetical protein DLAC_02000 [Tieghemostelium lacteum]